MRAEAGRSGGGSSALRWSGTRLSVAHGSMGRPERHEHEELVAVGAQEIDEGPGRVDVPAERVEDERQPLLLPDRLEVARARRSTSVLTSVSRFSRSPVTYARTPAWSSAPISSRIAERAWKGIRSESSLRSWRRRETGSSICSGAMRSRTGK